MDLLKRTVILHAYGVYVSLFHIQPEEINNGWVKSRTRTQQVLLQISGMFTCENDCASFNQKTFLPLLIFLPCAWPHEQSEKSSCLNSIKQQYNLKYINNTIATYFPFLAEIPHDTFLTEKDNIHWKPATAQLIFNYWLKQLNL